MYRLIIETSERPKESTEKLEEILELYEAEELYYHQILDSVTEKFEELEQMDLRVFICETTDYALKKLRETGLSGNMLDELSEYAKSGVPFSFDVDDVDFVFIFVSGDGSYLKANKKALEGLFAHEIMHAIHRKAGIDRDIEIGVEKVYNVVKALAEELPVKDSQDIMKDVLKKTILTLKDIFADRRIMARSFTDSYLEHLYNLIGVKKFCPAPDFGNDDVENLVEKIKFEIQIMSAWLPIVDLDHPKAKKIMEHIEECYEVNLKEVAKRFRDLEILYTQKFSMTVDFIMEFIISVTRVVYQILAGDMFVVNHLISAMSLISETGVPEKDLIITTLLKAIHNIMFRKKSREREYEDRLREYEKALKERLTEEDFEEWMEIIDEYDKDDLLKLPLFLMVKYAREQELNKVDDDTPLNAINLIADSAYEVTNNSLYIDIRNCIILDFPKFGRDHIKKAKELLKYEFALHKLIFDDILDADLAMSLLKNFDKFDVEITNELVDGVITVIKAYGTVQNKEPKEELLPILIRSQLNTGVDSRLVTRVALLALNLNFDFVGKIVEKVSDIKSES
jgi:uncharacterized protein YqeY